MGKIGKKKPKRYRQDGGLYRETICITISKDVKNLLDRVCERRGTNRSAFIAMKIHEEFYSKEELLYRIKASLPSPSEPSLGSPIDSPFQSQASKPAPESDG